ncbi:MAG: phosphoribosylformylglycinamidine synthase [Treponema sp.]|nr:phosphoribosylformylglycinamidine synthase [Treponema sp.]
MSIYELYVEKKPDFAEEAIILTADLHLILQIETITKIRIINRYFTEGISVSDYETAKNTVFCEPPLDIIYDTIPSFTNTQEKVHVFAVEDLPGQYDQRADYCASCISMATGKERPVINTAKIYVIYGNVSANELLKIKSWLINPVEKRETSLIKPDTLIQKFNTPKDVDIIYGFISVSNLEEVRLSLNLAMDISDLKFCQDYFRDKEKRDPTITEIRVLDTYWSDHCRHTTFLTELDEVQIDNDVIRESYNNYLELRASLGRSDKPITMMDMATIGTKALKQKGLLLDLDESEEINACSVKIKVDVDGKDKDWLLMFKNETHNHPTEIEPFGGASTCLGGAIRDPLSGRAYVYQAMRITGAANPLQNEKDTLPGKLPQIRICRTAASGYSSYGNQIGLTAGHIHEIYHPGYAAKRMELGAVIGAAPAENVVRKKPEPGDVVILLGGRTGRDGIGAAASSSKSHTSSSLETCGADVQKGNPAEERKIQRLFRNPEATKLIKRCNDFGAGGVSVSVGELADGLLIDLNKVTTKYDGLDGTELAISESQERMSLVIAKKDIKAFLKLSSDENLEATIIAEVTKNARLVMNWNGKTIVNLSREFLNSNGAKKYAKAKIGITNEELLITNEELVIRNEGLAITSEQEMGKFVSGLNVCSQKGLIDRFDSTAGAATVITPLGGKYQLTPAQIMAAKIPLLTGETNTCSLMSWGFDPYISEINPYHGAIFAVVMSIAKIIAGGGQRKNCWLSLQEYFERLRDEPVRWGKPVSALLGALEAQLGLEAAAIGGKDSMSGSFEEIDVPPTLVSFAVCTAKIDNIITPEFKKTNSKVYHFKPPYSAFEKPDFTALCEYFNTVEKLITDGKILSAWVVGSGGTAEAVFKMCMGNRIGFTAENDLCSGNGFGGFLFESKECVVLSVECGVKSGFSLEYLGSTTEDFILKTRSFKVSLDKLQGLWLNTLEPVYPYLIKQDGKIDNLTYETKDSDLLTTNHTNSQVDIKARVRDGSWLIKKGSKPKFLIPVFPDTNGEYDMVRAIEKAGGEAQPFIIRNLTVSDIRESVKGFIKAVSKSQVLIFAGGYSGSDEPSGYGKFITSFFCNPVVSEAAIDLLRKRDGLIYGVGSGFQALIRLGLLPYGELRDITTSSPALSFNTIGRHQSTFVTVKIVSNKSPWLSNFKPGEQFIVPISHGEGRFIADELIIKELAANGQIATQYVNFEGNASLDIRFNPNNSYFGIEGITSPDGRIFGRMSHTERYDDNLFRNIPDIRKMDIFSGAVNYFY